MSVRRSTPLDIVALADRLRAGDRRALAQAITLIESTRADHRDAAESLLARLLPITRQTFRIGLSGVPGVGKSTFIEAFGLHLLAQGQRVAVLAVDPSSQVTGGSILGDKTRMEELTRHLDAFIRPSPAGHTLGGVARRTREALLLCEAAGFDTVIVETVGVGQSETAVSEMTDLFCLLLPPGGGDELQGIKKGIVELADMIVVNKADGDLAAAANRAVAEYHAATGFLRPTRPDWRPPVLKCSALSRQGIDAVWATMMAFSARYWGDGSIPTRRAAQAAGWMWRDIGDMLVERLQSAPTLARLRQDCAAAVARGDLSPSIGARRLVDAFLD